MSPVELGVSTCDAVVLRRAGEGSEVARNQANVWLGAALAMFVALACWHDCCLAGCDSELTRCALCADNIECLRTFVKKMNEGREADIDSFFQQVRLKLFRQGM